MLSGFGDRVGERISAERMYRYLEAKGFVTLKRSSVKARLVLAGSVLTEVITGTQGAFLFLSPKAYLVTVGLMAWPLMLCFLTLSLFTNPRFWRAYRRVDTVTLWTIAVISAQAILYARLYNTYDTGVGYLANAIISMALMYWCCGGHVRAMCKYFPFTERSVYLYKVQRMYSGVFAVCLYLLADDQPSLSVSGSSSFLTCYLIFNNYLFLAVIDTERRLRAERRLRSLSTARILQQQHPSEALHTPLLAMDSLDAPPSDEDGDANTTLVSLV